MTLAVVLAGTLLLAAAGAWRWRPVGTSDRPGQFLRLALLAPALFCILLLAARSAAFAQSDCWSFVRLAPAIAQARGTPLYHPEGQGPLLGWSYGPMMPLVHLPLGLLRDPSVALAASSVLCLTVLLLPLLLSIWRALPLDPGSRVTAVILLAATQALLMHSEPSLYWLRRVQVDAFAMGLWQMGAVVLMGAAPGATVSGRVRWMAASFFVASTYSKHNELVLAAIPIVYLAVRDGLPSALRMTFSMAVLGFGGFLLCLLCWGWDALFLNLWLVPARHPWTLSGIPGLAAAAERFLEVSRGAVAIVLALMVCDHGVGARAPTVREWLAERPWVLPAAAALLIFPVSLVGRIKVGGDDNSFHSVYFIAVSAAMIVARWTAPGRPEALRTLLPALACVTAITGTALADFGDGPLDAQFSDSLLRREFRFSKEHPREVWFGANPLVTIYTDGKVYHQGYGVYDRTLPNLPPTPRHLREFLPSDLRWICTPPEPWWRPEPATPTRAPAGLTGDLWFELKPGH